MKIRLSKKATEVLKALKSFEKNSIRQLNPQRFREAIGSDKAKTANQVLNELISKNLLSESLELTPEGDNFSSSIE